MKLSQLIDEAQGAFDLCGDMEVQVCNPEGRGKSFLWVCSVETNIYYEGRCFDIITTTDSPP